ncbi:MAG: hypothetical protein U9O89_00790 [Thermoproteota archaeon]|nr:hypothetical protein [Thermoproteota archaeon]
MNRKIINQHIGENLQQGLELFSRIRLNAVFLFVCRCNQLNDGQKYRCRIANLIKANRQYWVMNEFCSTLDRCTAKIVAFSIQKIARREGNTQFTVQLRRSRC